MNPKRWVCEDSVLLARLDDGGWLAAVADAHWGGLSGELAVRSVEGEGTTFRIRLPVAQ